MRNFFGIVVVGGVIAIACGGCGASQPERVEPVAIPSATASAVTPPRHEPSAPLASEGVLDVPERDPRKFTGRNRSVIEASLAEAQRQYEAMKTAVTLTAIASLHAELAQAAPPGSNEKWQLRGKAIDLYDRVEHEFPYSRLAVEASYYLALEHELNGDLEIASESYTKFLHDHPSSPLRSHVMFAVGELGLADAKKDPAKIAVVNASYERVDAESPLYPWALLREGQLAVLAHDDAAAAQAFGTLKEKFPESRATARMHESLAK